MQLPTAQAPIAIHGRGRLLLTRSSDSTISGSHAIACTWLMWRSRSSISSDSPYASAEKTAANRERVVLNTYAYVKHAASSGPDITTAVHDRSRSPKTTFGR